MSRVGRLASRLVGKQATRKVARTLYHGTTVDNEASIRQIGLVGGVGKFTEWAYEENLEAGEDLPEIVFAADKGGLGKAVNAMVHHIGAKLGKDFHGVTDNDILNHGLLVIIYDEENRIEQRPEEDENYHDKYPSHVEPGDYFSEELSADKFVKGRQLLRLLERYGQWPRTYGPKSNELARLNKMRGELIARWLRQNPEKTKQEAMNLVQGLPDAKVEQYFRQYVGGR
jgi:hypothetical protein